MDKVAGWRDDWGVESVKSTDCSSRGFDLKKDRVSLGILSISLQKRKLCPAHLPQKLGCIPVLSLCRVRVGVVRMSFISAAFLYVSRFVV